MTRLSTGQMTLIVTHRITRGVDGDQPTFLLKFGFPTFIRSGTLALSSIIKRSIGVLTSFAGNFPRLYQFFASMVFIPCLRHQSVRRMSMLGFKE